MWKSPIGLVRTIGLIEGVSFVLLLGVAMPLKYAADMPMAVRIVGMAHGVLFIGLLYAVLRAVADIGWSRGEAARVIIASLLPFGPFVIDGRLKRQDQELRAQQQ